MLKLFSLLVLVSASTQVFAHQDMMASNHLVPVSSFSARDAEYVDPLTVESEYLFVKPMKLQGFTGSNLTKMNNAFKVLEKVVNSEAFKDKILNFKNTKGERQFASNMGLSNEQIFEIFMSGRETLQQNTPGEMNFYLKLYNSWWSRVIGWTNPDINTININKKYFTPNSIADVAANLAHEWTHKIGFDHASASEHDSAPYAIGYIVGRLAEQELKRAPAAIY